MTLHYISKIQGFQENNVRNISNQPDFDDDIFCSFGLTKWMVGTRFGWIWFCNSDKMVAFGTLF